MSSFTVISDVLTTTRILTIRDGSLCHSIMTITDRENGGPDVVREATCSCDEFVASHRQRKRRKCKHTKAIMIGVVRV